MIYHDVVVRFPSAASHLIVHCLSSSMYRCTHMHIHCTSIAHPFIGTCKQTDIDQQTHRYSKEQMHCTWNTSTLHGSAWHRSASHNMTLLCLAYTALICIACHCICYTLHYVSCFHCRQCMQRAQTHTHTDTQMPMHIA